MIRRLYVVRDTLAGSIVGGVVAFAHDAAAVRFFGDAATDPNTAINRHPADHDLLVIGEIDDEAASIRPIGPDVIVNAATLLSIRSEKTERTA